MIQPNQWATTDPTAPPSRLRWLAAVGLGVLISITVGASIVFLMFNPPVAVLAGLLAGSYGAGRFLPARSRRDWLVMGGLVVLGQMALGYIIATFGYGL